MRKFSRRRFLSTLERRKTPSPLSHIDYTVFLIPVLLVLIGTLILILTLLLWPTDLRLIVLGQMVIAIGLFVAILLGFWVMTIIRIPRD